MRCQAPAFIRRRDFCIRSESGCNGEAAAAATQQKPAPGAASLCFDSIGISEVCQHPGRRVLGSAQLGTSSTGLGSPGGNETGSRPGAANPVLRAGEPRSGRSCGGTQLLSCVRSSRASRTDASISTRLIETLSTLIPNDTPRVRQYVISSVAVARAC